MSNEPDHLASLGEFATLKNAIGSWYHQDAYLDFETDEEIWTDIASGHDPESLLRLRDQLSALLLRPDDEIMTQVSEFKFSNKSRLSC